MKAAWIGRAAVPSTSTVNYNFVVPSSNSLWSATENGTAAGDHKVIPLSEDVTVTKFSVWTDADPGSGNSWTFTLRDDLADTSAAVTISGTGTSGSWSGSVNIAALSLVSMKSTPTSDPSSPLRTYWIIEYETAGDYYLMLTGEDDQSTTALDYHLPGTGHVGGRGTTTTWGNLGIMPSGATVTKIAGKCGAAPGSGKSRTFFPRYSGVDASFSAVVSGTNKVAVSSSGSFAVADSGSFTVKVDATSSPTAGPVSSCMTVAPDTPGDIALLYASDSSMDTSNSDFYAVAHSSNASWLSESLALIRLPECTLTNLIAWIATAPGSGNQRVFTVRSNLADTGVVATISDTATNASSANTASHADGDVMTIKRHGVSNPASSAGGRMSVSMIIDQPETDTSDFWSFF